MTKVSFIVTVHNKEDFIGSVLDSLKKVAGDFRKEFIIVNDGSTDNSLEAIKKYSKELPNTTIISRENKGPSISANEGLFLAHGEYIKFLDGDDTIDPEAAICLMKAIEKTGNRVAFGLRGLFDPVNQIYTPSNKKSKETIIHSPVKALLGSKYKFIRSIRSSPSMVKRDLIEEVAGSDSEIFVQDYSLALRCASRTNFIFTPKTVCYKRPSNDQRDITYDENFESLNTLLALKNFIDFDPETCKKLTREIYKSVLSSIWKLNRKNYLFLPRYAFSRIFTPKKDLSELQNFIDENIKKYIKK